MRDDLEVITKVYPKSWSHINVYALGDIHVGSPEFNESAIRKKLQIIEQDPHGCVVLCGDLGDFGLKNSVSNVYKQTMSPKAQVEYLYELFLPVKCKITAAVPGNHEERLVRDVGICPLYDLCVRWGCEDVYRENIAITKYSFGVIGGGKEQQNLFFGLTTHGTTRNKHKKFLGCFEGVDFAVSGHTHTPEYTPHGKIRVERINGNASHVPYKEIVVDANMVPGGYGMKKEYEVMPPPELQYLELRTIRESNHTRRMHRIMNYHSVQI